MKNFLYPFIIFLSFSVYSCSDDSYDSVVLFPLLSAEPPEVLFSYAGGEKKVKIIAENIIYWDAYSEQDWINLQNMSGREGDDLIIIVQEHTGPEESLEGYIVVSSPDSKDLRIKVLVQNYEENEPDK